MRVSERLFIAVVPAVLGVLLVAALAYWGEFGRTAPLWLVAVAGVTAVLSLVVTWRNTRYVAERIERLAGLERRSGRRSRSPLAAVKEVALPQAGAAPDEIDRLAGELERLNTEAVSAQAEGLRREREAASRVEEYAEILAECAATVERQLEEVRLPLHILLENHFGTLNENQEEMIAAARQAADQAGIELGRLKAIASLDREALSLRRESVHLAELLRGLRPQIMAEAARRGLTVEWDLAPGLPRVVGDRDRLVEALELLLRHLTAHATAEAPLRIGAERGSAGTAMIVVGHGPASMIGPDVILARRVIAAHGGSVELTPTATRIVLPTGSA